MVKYLHVARRRAESGKCPIVVFAQDFSPYFVLFSLTDIDEILDWPFIRWNNVVCAELGVISFQPVEYLPGIQRWTAIYREVEFNDAGFRFLI